MPLGDFRLSGERDRFNPLAWCPPACPPAPTLGNRRTGPLSSGCSFPLFLLPTSSLPPPFSPRPSHLFSLFISFPRTEKYEEHSQEIDSLSTTVVCGPLVAPCLPPLWMPWRPQKNWEDPLKMGPSVVCFLFLLLKNIILLLLLGPRVGCPKVCLSGVVTIVIFLINFY